MKEIIKIFYTSVFLFLITLIVEVKAKILSLGNSDAKVTVKMGKEMREGTLVLNVIHGKELEVEYKKNEIMDKINSFFGYKCIRNVVLKIVQDTVKPKKNFPKIKDFSKIEDKMSKVNDDALKSSLNNFLKAFNERNN